MALIAVCVHATEDNDRLKYTKQSLESLLDTVDLKKHHVHIMDNASSQKAKEVMNKYLKHFWVSVYSENIGTARALNFALKLREPNEVCIKADDDVLWHQKGWADELEETIFEAPHIGVLGLKRKDVWQHPAHENPAYRTHMAGKLEICADIIGTCTAFNPALLDKIGYSFQPSPFYGGEDVIFCVRSLVAGFVNAFLPHIPITHLDDGVGEYTKWKQREASRYMGEIGAICEMIKSGKMPYYYDGE